MKLEHLSRVTDKDETWSGALAAFAIAGAFLSTIIAMLFSIFGESAYGIAFVIVLCACWYFAGMTSVEPEVSMNVEEGDITSFDAHVLQLIDASESDAYDNDVLVEIAEKLDCGYDAVVDSVERLFHAGVL